MKLRNPLNLLALIVLSLATGCASIVSKSNWPVAFDTNPSGAEVVIRDISGAVVHRGTTPTSARLRSGGGYFSAARYDVEATLEGYQVGRGSVLAELNGWYFGNLGFGGLVGFLVVDPLTGAMYKLPSHYMLNLHTPGAAAAADCAVQFVSIHDLPEELRDALIPVH
jgi:hypothetical protein